MWLVGMRTWLSGVSIEDLSVESASNRASSIIKSKLTSLHVNVRNKCLTSGYLLSYSDDAYIFRMLNY